MKKLIISLLLVTVSLSVFSGCGSKKTDNDATEEISENTPTNNEQEKEGLQKDIKVDTNEYVVKVDDSFDSGVDFSDTRTTLSPEEADFRNLKWGMSKEDVAYVEGNTYKEPKENVMYYNRVREEDFPCDAEYTFEDDKLMQGLFYITQNKEDKPVTIDDYKTLVNDLAKRFSEPSISDMVFKDESLRTDNVNKQVDLIKEGQLQYRTGWMLDDTELRVVLYGSNAGLCIGLQYKKA